MGQKSKLYSVKLPNDNYKGPIFALIIGALITAFSSFLLYEFEEAVEKKEFSLDANARTAVMEENLTNTLEIVHSIHALFAASEYVTRVEFDIFAGIEMSFQRNIQAIEWIPRVARSERNQFEANADQDGLDSFRFTEKSQAGAMVTASERDEYYPVYYVYPMKGNEAAIGYDLASNPARLEALNKARDTGQLQATQRITLVQETGNQFGILVFQPIYEYGDDPNPNNS